MDYAEVVAAIAHIDAAKSIMGMRCPDNVTEETYCSLQDARNGLNRTRLEMLIRTNLYHQNLNKSETIP
jgi:hypothetical protein